ncbi:MAG: DUF192 domain-containing protein [Bryobacteraceae bacterium]
MPRLLAAALLVLASCRPATTLDEFLTREITLPDGFKIRAEVMTRPEDMMRGMMFRNELPEGRGMLFVHGEPGNYAYWMYQVRIPLDIVWLDSTRRIVEVSQNTPPCKTVASQCPQYGGKEKALMILELPAGSVARHNLRVGNALDF